MDAYEALANAIILQAMYDYRDIQNKLKKHPSSKQLASKQRALERFFDSQWYATLTSIDPDLLLEWLKKREAKRA